MDRKRFDEVFNSVYVVQDSEELYWLTELVEALHPSVIIEVGVEMGGTLKFWEQLVLPKGLVIGIDLYNRVGWPYRESPASVHVVEGDSHSPVTVETVRKLLNGAEADFLFIDATHTSEAARRDFENYGQFLRSGGLVGFHDIGDVQSFFDSLQGRKEVKRMRIGTGAWWKP